MLTAALLLSLMSLFDSQGIPQSPFYDRYRRVDEQTDFEEDIHTLTSYSLIEMSLHESEFEMHRLV
jgi:hypothetical protein